MRKRQSGNRVLLQVTLVPKDYCASEKSRADPDFYQNISMELYNISRLGTFENTLQIDLLELTIKGFT